VSGGFRFFFEELIRHIEELGWQVEDRGLLTSVEEAVQALTVDEATAWGCARVAQRYRADEASRQEPVNDGPA
jgi:hypothetical protein